MLFLLIHVTGLKIPVSRPNLGYGGHIMLTGQDLNDT